MPDITYPPAVRLATTDHGENASRDGASPDRSHGSYHILLVDDDDNYSSLVKDVLGFADNYFLDRAPNLHGMWSLLEHSTYDALLLDYSFPDGSGLEALRQLMERKIQVPVIIVTGRGDERVAAQAIQQGAIDYLVKSPETVFELPVLISKAVRNYAYQAERVKSLEKIRYQALLLDNVRDAVVVWNSAGCITYWNPAAEQLYGWPAPERMGLPAAQAYAALFTPPPDPVSYDANLPLEVERRAQTRRGETVWIGSRVTELHDEFTGGALLGFMDVTRDITARKQAEEQIRAAQASLGGVGSDGRDRGTGGRGGASNQQSAHGDHRRGANSRTRLGGRNPGSRERRDHRAGGMEGAAGGPGSAGVFPRHAGYAPNPFRQRDHPDRGPDGRGADPGGRGRFGNPTGGESPARAGIPHPVAGRVGEFAAPGEGCHLRRPRP